MPNSKDKESAHSQAVIHKKTIFITGAAGYIGAILSDQFSGRNDIETIVCLDKDEIPELLKENEKIVWITIITILRKSRNQSII